MATQSQLILVDLKKATADLIFEGSVIESVAISADGAWAVTTGVPPGWDYLKHEWNGPRTIRLFDLKQRSCVWTWEAHRAYVSDLALSRDGRYLATASRDRTAHLFDLRNERILGSWRSAHEIHAIAISPTGHRVAYAFGGGVLTVRRKDGHILVRFKDCFTEPGCLALSKDGGKVVTAGEGDVWVFDLNTKKRNGPLHGPQPYLSSLVIDDAARCAMTGDGPQLVLWDLTKTQRRQSSESWISGIWAGRDQALVHQDGLSVWDLATGQTNEILPPGSFYVTAAPGAKIWAIARWSAAGVGRIRIGKFGCKSSTPFLESSDFSRGMITSMQLSRDGHRLLALVHRNGCRVLNLADSSTVWQRVDLGLGVRPFLSPSGRYVALCSLDGETEIVDLETREAIQRRQLRPNIGKVLFDVDEESIFIEQGAEIVTWNWKGNSLSPFCAGKPSSVSDDGLWLVTESNLRKLTLWALPEKRRVASYTLDSPVRQTALSPDGKFLIAGDHKGGVHILEKG